MSVVALDGVSFGYADHPVVEDVTLTVDPGEFVGLVGPNGSGKSTLVRIALGLVRPDRGTARLFGSPAHRDRDGTRVGYVAQQATRQAGEMPVTVREVVRMGRYPHVRWRFGERDRRAVDAALDRVGVTDLADRQVRTLSGGQRQRVFIARALASEADLLVFDEPVVGVDTESRTAFYDLLDALNEEGLTVLLIDHDIGVVTAHADRVVCLDCRVRFDGDTDAFAESDALDRSYGPAHRTLDHSHGHDHAADHDHP
ncbi:ATP-binding cassette domain-containing protein [Halomarina oriensis]|uniref:Cobalamin import ATP-binding protein BtuD n=1 Tax=Halomarina oriensis TaxID=671145 RepID=A0A6B0GJW3_9EURY|nr:ATP-binding cassette domain-containing protein [Halomarina oriensis]